MIGSLGDIPFEVTPDRIRTFREISRRVAARWSEHAIAGRKPSLEFVGPSLDEVSLSVRLSATDGLNPRKEIERIALIVATGEVLPLIIGGEFLGVFAVMESSESRRVHASGGELMIAEVSLTLKEYIDDL